MLSVILIWCYMLMTTFFVGYGILRIITHRIPYQIRHMDSYLFCGLVGVTVYAQFFSLVCKVGLLANLILCTVCFVIVWFDRKALGSKLKVLWSDIKRKGSGKRGRMLVILFLFLLFAYGTSRGIIHYDTGLYHAQSIRWLEEYGVVKGLGNLHCRLAYNSSSFALSALYSMSFLGGQSYHCCAGFLAFILAVICLRIIDSIRNGRLCTGDFARVMCIYYLVIIFDEMVSPASDYFMVLTAFYIVIRWLDLLEQQEKTVLPYALLCVLGVFLMTVKLSAALILILVIHPAYYILKEKRWREIILYLFLGVITALPYFIRNVIISGWLVYPFTQIDLFEVPWKIPKGLADYDAREIQVWGRGYTDVTQFDRSVFEWLPDWFRALAGSDKLLVLVAGCSVAILIVYGLVLLWKRTTVPARQWQLLLVQMTVAGSFLFWLGTSPLIRYGCVYVYLTSAVVLGGIYDVVINHNCRAGNKWRYVVSRLCIASVALLVAYKLLALGGEIIRSYSNDYWLTQKYYENYEVIPYELEGVTFYYPARGDQVGYESFPSSPAVAQIGFLGEDIADGFYSLP
ncbi:MAG: hypothetical protein MR523_08820 [Lachnospiraceae bacterium]|nr:hypothetical protein [Lachnospiraceae bacterium]